MPKGRKSVVENVLGFVAHARATAKLPRKFTIDDVRKLAGKAAGISLAQWARAKKIKKTASGYQKVA